MGFKIQMSRHTAMAGFAALLMFSVGSSTEDMHFWYEEGGRQLREALSQESQRTLAKNVVLFVGDGMGLSTITAGRIYRGQQLGLDGEEYRLAFEKFGGLGLAKTYNVNAQVGDSAACATALFTGVKTHYHRVGVDSSSAGDSCSVGRPLTSLVDWAQEKGMSTGLVTNTRLTHSTPSAAYAHVGYRKWESQVDVPGCQDIALQLVENRPGRDIDVLLGGGRREFLPFTSKDPESKNPGMRGDYRNLAQEWLDGQTRRGYRARQVWNRQQFDDIDPNGTHRVLGLFAESHMDFELDRDRGPGGQPSLAEMTVKAVQLLSRNPSGFLLIVEGGRIDHGHHANSALHAISEMAALEQAVTAAMNTTDRRETLLVVTADHSHVLTLGGQRSPRGNSILAGRMDHAHHANNARRALDEVLALEDAVLASRQLTRQAETLTVVTADHSHVFTIGGSPPRGNPVFGRDISNDRDGLPYTTLLYGNGPGYVQDRRNVSRANTSSPHYRQESAVPLKYETHAGEDVPVYADGPWSHLFSGTFEQSYVAHAISLAACIGPQARTEWCKAHGNSRPISNGGDTWRAAQIAPLLAVTLLVNRFFNVCLLH